VHVFIVGSADEATIFEIVVADFQPTTKPSALGQATIFEIVAFDFEPSRRKRVRLTVKHHELEARGLREAERAAVGRQ
jgi:hypothetical protein